MRQMFSLAVLEAAANYTIIRIEDEETPLALISGNTFLTYTLMILGILAVLLGIVRYMIECHRLQTRIHKLDEADVAYRGYKISRLRDTLADLEMKKLDEICEI